VLSRTFNLAPQLAWGVPGRHGRLVRVVDCSVVISELKVTVMPTGAKVGLPQKSIMNASGSASSEYSFPQMSVAAVGMPVRVSVTDPCRISGWTSAMLRRLPRRPADLGSRRATREDSLPDAPAHGRRCGRVRLNAAPSMDFPPHLAVRTQIKWGRPPADTTSRRLQNRWTAHDESNLRRRVTDGVTCCSCSR
jgi:hypothetical protein